MKRILALKFTLFFLIYLFTGLFFLLKAPGYTFSRDIECYALLLVTFISLAGFLLITYVLKGIDIFEPILLVTMLYLMMFSVVPLINMLQNETLCFGVDVMDGCVRATLIFLASYAAFYFGYYQKLTVSKRVKLLKYAQTVVENEKPILRKSIIIWVVCYLLSIIQLLSSRKTLTYILTLGLMGGMSETVLIDAPLGFLYNFGYSMIPAWMYICV